MRIRDKIKYGMLAVILSAALCVSVFAAEDETTENAAGTETAAPETEETPADTSAADEITAALEPAELSKEAVAEEQKETENETALVLTDEIMESSNITDRKFVSGMVQVFIGYLFDDGSFDPWYTAPGFAVNRTTVVTSPDAVISETSALYMTTVAGKYAGYASIGVNLNDFSLVSEHLMYRIYDGGRELLPAYRISRSTQIPDFTVLSVQGLLGSSYKLYEAALTPDLQTYAIGIVPEALAMNHYLTSSDFLEQAITPDNISATDQFSYKTDSTGIFNFCPIVNKDGTIVGYTESFDSETGLGNGRSVNKLEELLDIIGVSYEVSGMLADPVNLDKLENALKKADLVNLKSYTEDTVAKYTEALEKAKSALENKEISQKDADDAAEALIRAIASLQAKAEPKPASWMIFVYIAAGVFGLAAAGYVSYVYIKKNAKKKREPFEDEEEAFADPTELEENPRSRKEKGLFGRSERKTIPEEEPVKEPAKASGKPVRKEAKKAPIEKKPEREQEEVLPAEPAEDRKLYVAPDDSEDDEEAVSYNEATVHVSKQKEEPDKSGRRSAEPDRSCDRPYKKKADLIESSPELDKEFVYDEFEDRATRFLGQETYRITRKSTGESAVIEETPFLIGRQSSTCSFTVKNDAVGRKHICITEEDGEYFLEDLKSLNGTKINGEICETGKKYPLHAGDVITIANEDLLLSEEDA